MRHRTGLLIATLAACTNTSTVLEPDQVPDHDRDGELEPVETFAPVRISVMRGGTPVVGAAVVFQAPDNTSLVETATDAQGIVSASVAPGSSVTIVEPLVASGRFAMITMLDLQPGDDILIGPSEPPATASIGQAQVQVAGPFAGATRYAADAGCNGSSHANPASIPTFGLTSDCLTTNGTYDVVALAVDASNQPLAYAPVANLTPPGSGSTATVTAPAWRTDFAPHTTLLVNAPLHAAFVQGTLTPMRDGVRRIESRDGKVLAPGGSATLPFKVIDGTTTNQHVLDTIITFDDQPGHRVGVHYVRSGSPVTSETIDLSSVLPPRIYDVGASMTTEPRLTWTAEGSLANLDGARVTLQWANGPTKWSWTVVAPPTVTSPLVLPVLPPAFSVHRPLPGQIFTQPTIEFTESDLYADWDAYRQDWSVLANVPYPAELELRRTYAAGP